MKTSIHLILLLFSVVAGEIVFAGNIDPLDNNSSYCWQENTGWMNGAPERVGDNGLIVYSDRVEGYLWAENIGWINFSPIRFGGVTNDGLGNLGGYAWGENVGWINFAPEGGGVVIDYFTGQFSGYAWAENIGWINFNGNLILRTSPMRTSWSIWQEDNDSSNEWYNDPDGDGIVNLLDQDADNDGLFNDDEFAMWGADWNSDFDGDGLYNLIDPDADGDGKPDGDDLNPFVRFSLPLPAMLLLL